MSGPGSIDGDLSADDGREFDADDWTDQDLLTKDEATLRLTQAARVTRDMLAKAQATAPDQVPDLERRLRQIEVILRGIEK